MSRKRRPLPLLESQEITAVAAEGNSLIRLADPQGFVVFVPYGAPGDIVDVQIDKKRSSYAQGHIVRLVKPSEDYRTEPRCSHFGVCGGCKWQHLPYSFQLECKQQQVADALDRIGHVEHPPLRPIVGSENIYGYRNKLEFTFSNRKWLTREQLESGETFDVRDGAGFHISGAFDKVLDIENCHLQETFADRVRLFVRDYARERGFSFYDLKANKGLMRTMMIRTATTGEKMILLVFGEDDRQAIDEILEAVREKFPETTSLLWTVNPKVNDTFADLPIHTAWGRGWIEETMKGGALRFRIGPKSFYQTNSRQAEKLYSVVEELAGLTGNELVYDLYTGTGTIAQFVADGARHVVGIEYVEDAVADARLNADVNGLSEKTEFYAGDMKDMLTDEFIAEHGHPDVVIVDPPRAGMHSDVVATLLNASPNRIVYVSCNPATQARDLAMLSEAYEITAVQPVDMFPHTAHVENVVALERREK